MIISITQHARIPCALSNTPGRVACGTGRVACGTGRIPCGSRAAPRAYHVNGVSLWATIKLSITGRKECSGGFFFGPEGLRVHFRNLLVDRLYRGEILNRGLGRFLTVRRRDFKVSRP